MDSVKEVDIDSDDTFKYVLIEIKDKQGNMNLCFLFKPYVAKHSISSMLHRILTKND